MSEFVGTAESLAMTLRRVREHGFYTERGPLVSVDG